MPYNVPTLSNIEAYLCKRFNETHWPYYSMTETLYLTGSTKDDLNALFERKMVRKASGTNGFLIEIINWDTKWNIYNRNNL